MDLNKLPTHLTERCRWVWEPNGTEQPTGEFVLYWAHNALRAHENPALDVAIALARENDLPLLVYHGLSEEYPFASDRLHAFMLQGHRDLQLELADRGIESVFDLQREGHRGPHLRELTRRAAVLVTEDMPVEPITGWLERLKQKTETPMLSVDASCIVAAPLLNRSFTRAFKFREATRKLYAQRVSRGYQEQTVDVRRFDGDVSFQSLWLADENLSESISQCRIDHTIAPVIDTPGGSRAGYERWNRFREHGLSQYAKKRNNAAIHDGVSRMSAYLHFGMVSPFRVAREADEYGAEKFLDELLIWRELAFHYCYHHSHLIDTMDALPDWARETLTAHAADDREASFSWETLARAQSGKPLWDLCQRSLLKHGELHNNVRMTWGKAFLPWTSSPQRALELTLDLNHRYALDGRDPSSYGGILWCFGQFDRPFSPEEKILGSVRPRPISFHQQRLDLERYQRVVDRPIADSLPRVAVIGAGLAGLMAARTLADHGIEVEILEKSRGVGGRLATRRAEDGVTFDHGAQYFTVKDRRFGRYVESWVHDGIVQPWQGRIVELKSGGEVIEEKTGTTRYVGVPGMNAVAKHLAAGLDIRQQAMVTKLSRQADGWQLLDDNEQSFGTFDIVLVNCPAPQAAAILAGHSSIAEHTASVSMRPCWAMMLQVDGDAPPFAGAFINDGPLSWIARNADKPERSENSTWVVHATPEWSEANLELDDHATVDHLLSAFEDAIGKDVRCMSTPIVHRWRYAIPANPLSVDYLWDANTKLGACGDWCGGPRVEGAFLSGAAMAGAVLRKLTIDQPVPRSARKLVQPSLLT